jgi:hypothetical protein
MHSNGANRKWQSVNQVSHAGRGVWRKFWRYILACAALQSGIASAQDVPRIEVFGAYAYLIYDISTANHTNMNGWEASLGYNVNRLLAVEGDVSGYYRYDYWFISASLGRKTIFTS